MRGVVAAGVVATALAVGANAAWAGASVGAVDDLYETPFETPVTIDPLENDVLPEFAIIDGPHFVSDPQHGTLDGLEYTPDAGFSGTDSFDYYFTWEWEEVAARFAQQVVDPEVCNIEFQCSMATVFVEVGAPPATTTTTAAPATTTTPTTVATQVVEPTTTTTQVAAQAELPRTGGAPSRAWAPLGAATLLAGLVAMRLGRRQNPRRI